MGTRSRRGSQRLADSQLPCSFWVLSAHCQFVYADSAPGPLLCIDRLWPQDATTIHNCIVRFIFLFHFMISFWVLWSLLSQGPREFCKIWGHVLMQLFLFMIVSFESPVLHDSFHICKFNNNMKILFSKTSQNDV
jgi:hypothetical protein